MTKLRIRALAALFCFALGVGVHTSLERWLHSLPEPEMAAIEIPTEKLFMVEGIGYVSLLKYTVISNNMWEEPPNTIVWSAAMNRVVVSNEVWGGDPKFIPYLIGNSDKSATR